MRKLSLILSLYLLWFVPAVCSAAPANVSNSNSAVSEPLSDSSGQPAPTVQNSESGSKLRNIGIGLSLSSLGPGIDIAYPLTHRSNIRAGFNDFSFSKAFNVNGTDYSAALDMRSADLFYDWFPFGGRFHLSPGLLVYNGNSVNGTGTPEYNFDLGTTTYTTSPNDPAVANFKLAFGHRVAPAILIGHGNLSPRNGKHFSFDIEAGVVFEGAPTTSISLTGGVCDEFGNNCVDASDPSVQANVQAEQTKLDGKMSSYKFYPLISLEFGFRL